MMVLLTRIVLLARETKLSLTPGWTEIRQVVLPYAAKASVADDNHLYAVFNTIFARYDCKSGKTLATATAPDAKHLNSALLHQGKLCCAHAITRRCPKSPTSESTIPRRTNSASSTFSSLPRPARASRPH
jgi:hypothetical protein